MVLVVRTIPGGPEGPAKEKTVYYWNKVLHHLQQPDSIDIITSARNGAPQSPRPCLAINVDSRTGTDLTCSIPSQVPLICSFNLTLRNYGQFYFHTSDVNLKAVHCLLHVNCNYYTSVHQCGQLHGDAVNCHASCPE